MFFRRLKSLHFATISSAGLCSLGALFRGPFRGPLYLSFLFIPHLIGTNEDLLSFLYLSGSTEGKRNKNTLIMKQNSSLCSGVNKKWKKKFSKLSFFASSLFLSLFFSWIPLSSIWVHLIFFFSIFSFCLHFWKSGNTFLAFFLPFLHPHNSYASSCFFFSFPLRVAFCSLTFSFQNSPLLYWDEQGQNTFPWPVVPLKWFAFFGERIK